MPEEVGIQGKGRGLMKGVKRLQSNKQKKESTLIICALGQR